MLYRRVVQRIHNERVQVETSLPARRISKDDDYESLPGGAETGGRAAGVGEPR